MLQRLAMTQDVDPFKLSSPRIFLVRMAIFLILFALIVVVIHQQIWVAFRANPPLNALIIGVLVIGILLAFRQVLRLFPEVAWATDPDGRSRHHGRASAGAARPDGGNHGRSHRPHGDVIAHDAGILDRSRCGSTKRATCRAT